MKLKLLALLVATGLAATTAHATTYIVGGTQAYSADVIDLPGAVGGVTTQTPNPPSFSGSWSVDPEAPISLNASFIFAPYAISVSTLPYGAVNLSIPNRVLTIDGGSYSYDVAARTLSITDVDFLENSPNATCIEEQAGMFCSFMHTPGVSSHGNLTLTFAPDLLSFTGVANVYQYLDDGMFFMPDPSTNCYGEGGANLCINNTLTFSGVAEVPVPAAAWLFGSGVLGLAGLKRRKAA